jgi:hypothetical protein
MEQTSISTYRKAGRADKGAAICAPFNFPDFYRTDEQIAPQKKVMWSWVVRDASEKYVADPKQVLRDE